jgi:hypothetical protein
MNANEPVYHKEKSAAEKLNLSVFTLRNWRSIGKGPRFCKFGRSVRYPSDELRKYADQRKVS